MFDNDPSRPTLDYGTARHTRRQLTAIAFIILGTLFLVIAGPTLLSRIIPRRNYDSSFRVKCQSNLRWIGQAILIYSNENHGEYPDSLAKLLMTEDINSSAFVCPSTNDTAATGPTTQAIAANLTTGGHLSYIYLARGWNMATTPANAVVAYEPLSNHSGAGINVLFGDGHVDWLTATQAKTILTNAAPGRPPVTMPTGQ